jgi:hypothetical protein
MYAEICSAEVVLNIERATQAITPLHFRLLLARAHRAIRSIAQVALLKGRTAGTYAFHHSVFVKRNFHGIRLQVFKIRRLLKAFLCVIQI